MVTLKSRELKKLLGGFSSNLKKMLLNDVSKFPKKDIKHFYNSIPQNNPFLPFEKSENNFKKNSRISMENKSDSFEIYFPQFNDYKLVENIFNQNLNLKVIKGISNCFVNLKDRSLHIKGANFFAFWKNSDIIEIKKIFTNDIFGMLITYGIEASKNCLMNELESIFKNQGISISIKHFDLITDYMTRLGNFRAFNRRGFKEEAGFQEITYETAINYIISSSFSGRIDNLSTISSQLALGIPSKIGTNCFDLTF